MGKKKDNEIIAESRAFVKQNKGMILDLEDSRAHNYISPRISSEFMDCSMPMTFDHLSHCSLGCTYCFAYFFKANNFSFNDKLRSANIKGIIQALNGKPKGYREEMFYKHFFKKKFLLHWGGLADPFCNFERNNLAGFPLIETLGEHNYPTLFSFKGNAVFMKEYVKLFEKYSKQANFAFQVSIITGNDALAKKIEIGVPSPSRRIESIRMLSDMGYFTILRLRPFIIGISEQGLDELLHKSLEAGIQAVSMEFFAVDCRTSQGMMKRYKWLGNNIGYPDLLSYFRKLSPSERGGYMRLNRLVKERFVKQVYTFCADNDLVFACSDPDFKELNTSGSCCGMPDRYPKNKLLENWTKYQLTYYLKEARRRYHNTGQKAYLHFHSVYRKADTYLDDRQLTNDHTGVSDMTAAQRQVTTYRDLARRIWNNLRSPGNPQNYFHGQLLPVDIDNSGDYVYKYNPSEYEERWKEEGIDLTR